MREWAVIALVFVVFFALAALPVGLITWQIPRNVNEGWNAYYALAAVSGTQLYPPSSGFLVNNYPPLSFYIVGAFGQVIGDNVVAGRLIALASLLIVAGNVYALCRWIGADRALAILGTGLFLLQISCLTFDYVALDDPQMLGHAFMTSAAVIFLRDATGHARMRNIFLSAVLILLGGLVKHNLIALPLALCTFAAIYNRRKLVEFLCIFCVLGLASLSLIYITWTQAIVDILGHARALSVQRMFVFSARALTTIGPYIILTGTACYALRRRINIHFIIAYAFWSAVSGFLPLAGAGTGLNLLYDLAIATAVGSVAFAMAVGEGFIPLPAKLNQSRLPVFLILALPLIVRAAASADRHIVEYVDKVRFNPQWQEVIRLLAETDGPVACDMLVICYWAGKPQEVDFFNFGQKLYAGKMTDLSFRKKIEDGYYRYIELEQDDSQHGWQFAKNWVGISPAARPGHEDAPFTPKASLPSATTALLLMHYKPIRTIGRDSILLAPKGSH